MNLLDKVLSRSFLVEVILATHTAVSPGTGTTRVRCWCCCTNSFLPPGQTPSKQKFKSNSLFPPPPSVPVPRWLRGTADQDCVYIFTTENWPLGQRRTVVVTVPVTARQQRSRGAVPVTGPSDGRYTELRRGDSKSGGAPKVGEGGPFGEAVPRREAQGWEELKLF